MLPECSRDSIADGVAVVISSLFFRSSLPPEAKVSEGTLSTVGVSGEAEAVTMTDPLLLTVIVGIWIVEPAVIGLINS